MDRLRFGTAGIPLSTVPHATEQGVRRVRELGLDAMELAFVHSVNIRPEKAPAVKRAAEEGDVLLTCHAPYYINLNATDPRKRKESADRILNAARILDLCGGWSVCFHPGYYLGMPPAQAGENIKDALAVVMDTLKEEDIRVWVRPEIGGKTTSFGSLEELLALCQGFDRVLPCVDWAHFYARSLGARNARDDFAAALGQIEAALGSEALKNMHCHVEGIEIGKTGERFHKDLGDSLNYRALVQAFKDVGLRGVVIAETPTNEAGALLLQKTYRSL